MKTRYLATILLAVSSCLLVACGGGSTQVRPSVSAAADPSQPPPPPPPPPPPLAEPCPMPITGNCVVNVPDTIQDMTGGRQSDYALVKQGGRALRLLPSSGATSPAVFRFGGGTTIEEGFVGVNYANLISDVDVQNTGGLYIDGTITGNVINNGSTVFNGGKVVGDVTNSGIFEPYSYMYSNDGATIPVSIEGNFKQASNGTLVATLVPTAGVLLIVTGRADIDGTLRLVRYSDWTGIYPLPAAPFSLNILHADGGVFGQFAQWTSPGLFITGGLRYLANDVYFDIATLSAAQVMGSAGAQALTVQSAARFDAALDNAANSATTPDPSHNIAQRQFLASAAAIKHLQDYDRAVRTFDSLSGSGHTAAIEALLLQSSMPDAGLMSRMDGVHPGSKLGAWSGRSSVLASSNGTFNGARAGFDQWLGDRLALGVSLGSSEGSLRFGRMGGTARDRSPQWDVYVQQLVGDGGYLFGDIGYGRHQLDTWRAIDLGIGQFRVTGMRDLDLLRTHVESGQHFRVGNGRLTLFGGLSHATLHGAGFAEQGGTGFELVAQPSTHQRTSATAGLRFGQAWRSGNRVTALNLAAGYSQILHARDNARAAFAGVPDATFALDALPVSRGSGWLQLGLGTGNERWNLGLNYDRQASNQALSLGSTFRF